MPGKSWRGRDAPTARGRPAVAWLLLAGALVLTIDAGWLHAKAWLAQQLLQSAWRTARATREPQRPWPWADTHPVARLRVPAHGIDQIVLAGDAGRTLAFGPGWAESSAPPGGRGTSVLSGHRDTHFAFLGALRVGEAIELDAAAGTQRYTVRALRVADVRREAIALAEGSDGLLLVTCFPFDAVVPGGPLRFVVYATPASPRATGGVTRQGGLDRLTVERFP